MSDANEEAFRLAGLEHRHAPTAGQTMTALRALAANPDSRIRVAGDGVEWLDEGEREWRDERERKHHRLDMDALRHRLKRRLDTLAERPPPSN